MSDERKSYNTTLRADLMKRLRILTAQVEKRQNDLLEEAIEDLLKKYEKGKQSLTHQYLNTTVFPTGQVEISDL